MARGFAGRPAVPYPVPVPSALSPRTSRTVVTRLTRWFAAHARDLPWRRTRDPYAVWISEIMLQQTQVRTVIPYWQRWMRALPDVAALARVQPARLLKLWEGLGYYRRAHHLHQAARLIMGAHGGRFPESYEDVLALPGVGRYTAGAICSIAFHSPHPIVDGNVIRVLTRLFGLGGDPRTRPVNDRLWEMAGALVTIAGPARCSAFNQSLMELGALVCTPRQPRCDQCPVRSLCVARRTHRVEALPALPRRAGATARRFVAVVLEKEGRHLVRRRPAGVVNAGLWEFPNLEAQGEEPAADLIRHLLGRPAASLHPLATVRHSITRYRITLEAYRVTLPRTGLGKRILGRWLTRAQLRRLAFTSAHRRVLHQLNPSGR